MPKRKKPRRIDLKQLFDKVDMNPNPPSAKTWVERAEHRRKLADEQAHRVALETMRTRRKPGF